MARPVGVVETRPRLPKGTVYRFKPDPIKTAHFREFCEAWVEGNMVTLSQEIMDSGNLPLKADWCKMMLLYSVGRPDHSAPVPVGVEDASSILDRLAKEAEQMPAEASQAQITGIVAPPEAFLAGPFASPNRPGADPAVTPSRNRPERASEPVKPPGRLEQFTKRVGVIRRTGQPLFGTFTRDADGNVTRLDPPALVEQQRQQMLENDPR